MAEKKKGFLGKLMEKIDKKMGEKAKQGGCCCCSSSDKDDKKDERSSCCG